MSKHKPATSRSTHTPFNKPAAPRSTGTPMTIPAARRIQSAVDKMPNPSPAQQGFKSRAMSSAAKK